MSTPRAGQTIAEIRALLKRAGLRPKYRFGQNFLADLNLMRKLITAAEVRPADTILEVGPGTGSLSEMLLDAGARVISVEIDRDLQALLRARLETNPRFTLVSGDALASKHALNPKLLAAIAATPPEPAGAIKLVANLPYQIATPLVVELLRLTKPVVSVLAVTIQKEVAERLGAGAGTDAYGPVSIMAQTLAEIEIIATLPPACFWPRPKVDSAMLLLRRRDAAEIAASVRSLDALYGTVQMGFQQRRKTMRRVLKSAGLEDVEARCNDLGFDAGQRPETLDPATWRKLSDALSAASIRLPSPRQNHGR